ncbi:hypothetical protein BuS5_03934 [Desulfosarcina sp. BuS5]|uniref:hypothetical protein n=1 Tax=Desulfosarcina sp. BuS5 TaxID=933262 RepID=UPI0023780557|nr:hypothetical protein [Desulfosarcina sp. BuS5]WDN90963.1 hypothetical protein BuS5_03934 [Desulfosarcina sp. BuS5]
MSLYERVRAKITLNIIKIFFLLSIEIHRELTENNLRILLALLSVFYVAVTVV